MELGRAVVLASEEQMVSPIEKVASDDENHGLFLRAVIEVFQLSAFANRFSHQNHLVSTLRSISFVLPYLCSIIISRTFLKADQATQLSLHRVKAHIIESA